MPRGLVAMGLVAIALGAADLAGRLGGFFTHDRPDFNLQGPLLIWLGVALLQRRDGARLWGSIACWLVLAAALVSGGFFVAEVAAGPGGPAGAAELVPADEVVSRLESKSPLELWLEHRLPTWARAAGIAGLIALSVPGILALRSAKSAGVFGVQRSARPSKALRRMAVAAGTAGALGAWGLVLFGTTLPASEDHCVTTRDNTGVPGQIAWGTRLGGVEYAVFYAGSPGNQQEATYVGGRHGHGAVVRLPDGRQLRLPGRHRLYQLTSADGIARTSDRHVPPDRLAAFLRQAGTPGGPRLTLDSLEAWLDKP